MRRPSIVLFLLDQMRADAVGATGRGPARSPNVDRIAASGVRFEQAVTSAPLCRPARISLMTGQPVHRHRFGNNQRTPEPEQVVSHVRRLRDEARYRTVVVGKTHLHTGVGHLDDHRGILARWGYDRAVELPDAMDYRTRSAHSDSLSPERDRVRRMYVASHPLRAPAPDSPPWRIPEEDHLDLFCARAASSEIERHRELPLYLQVCFPGPHPPFDAPLRFRRPPAPAEIPWLSPIPSGGTGPQSPITRRRLLRSGLWSEEALAGLRLDYLAKVALVDEAIGTVWAALERAGLLEEAWIILTADHGDMLGDNGLIGKVVCREASVRIPLILRPPGGIAGWTDRGTADLTDVTATILEIAGLAGDGLQGRVLGGPEGASAHRCRPILSANLGTVSIRDERYTLAWDRRLALPVELYDREADPQQRHNRANDPEMEAVTRSLVDEMRRQGALRI